MVDDFIAGSRSYGAYQSSGEFATYAVILQAAAMSVPQGFTYDRKGLRRHEAQLRLTHRSA